MIQKAKELMTSKYTKFFITGSSGVAINLGVTWAFTNFVFGLQNYFYAYIIGLAANLTYNFILHTKITFKTKQYHKRRFSIFIGYSLAMSTFQAFLVKTITPVVGLQYYLIVIATIILGFSVVTYFFFNYILFNDKLLTKKKKK